MEKNEPYWHYLYSSNRPFGEEPVIRSPNVYEPRVWVSELPEFPTLEEAMVRWMGQLWRQYPETLLSVLPRGFNGYGERGSFKGLYFRMTPEMKEWLRG